MRTVKLVLVAPILMALMIVMSANMAPVELHLIPEHVAPDLPTLPGAPLALVIVVAFLAGTVMGMLVELIRESKFRRRLNERQREVSALRDENMRLARRLNERGEDAADLVG